MFSDRDSRQLGRPSPENGGGDAKNLRVKVFNFMLNSLILKTCFLFCFVVVVIPVFNMVLFSCFL